MKKALIVLTMLAVALSAGAQTFVMNNGAEIESLDPAVMESVTSHRVYMALFEGLFISDPKTNAPLPGMATKYKFSSDYKTVTFTLRKAYWSDGVQVTAQDFVDSWIRKLDPKNAFTYADLLWDIVGAQEFSTGKGTAAGVGLKALNPTTFEVKLKNPTPHFVQKVVHYAFAVVPMHAIKKYGADWVLPKNLVVNGAYLLKEWRPQEKMVFTPNPKYWDAKNVKIKELVMLPIDDVNTAYNMYINGDIDWIDVVPAELMDTIKLRADYHVGPEYGTYYLNINVTKKPLDDARVRQALSMAFDRTVLTNTILKSHFPAFANVPPSAGYTPPKGTGYNPEEAKKLLAAAGYPGGAGFPKFQLLYNTSSNHQKVMQFIQAEWKKNLGIEVELINQEFTTYLDTKSAHDFDIARAGWIADYLDPATFLDMWETGNSQNDGLYSSKEYDALLAKSRTQLGAARLKTMMEAEAVLINKDMGIIPIYYYQTQAMIDLSKWNGWYLNPMNVHAWKFISPKK